MAMRMLILVVMPIVADNIITVGPIDPVTPTPSSDLPIPTAPIRPTLTRPTSSIPTPITTLQPSTSSPSPSPTRVPAPSSPIPNPSFPTNEPSPTSYTEEPNTSRVPPTNPPQGSATPIPLRPLPITSHSPMSSPLTPMSQSPSTETSISPSTEVSNDGNTNRPLLSTTKTPSNSLFTPENSKLGTTLGIAFGIACVMALAIGYMFYRGRSQRRSQIYSPDANCDTGWGASPNVAMNTSCTISKRGPHVALYSPSGSSTRLSSYLETKPLTPLMITRPTSSTAPSFQGWVPPTSTDDRIQGTNSIHTAHTDLDSNQRRSSSLDYSILGEPPSPALSTKTTFSL